MAVTLFPAWPLEAEALTVPSPGSRFPPGCEVMVGGRALLEGPGVLTVWGAVLGATVQTGSQVPHLSCVPQDPTVLPPLVQASLTSPGRFHHPDGGQGRAGSGGLGSQREETGGLLGRLWGREGLQGEGPASRLRASTPTPASPLGYDLR